MITKYKLPSFPDHLSHTEYVALNGGHCFCILYVKFDIVACLWVLQYNWYVASALSPGAGSIEAS